MVNLHEELFKNNSVQENCKEKLNTDVNTQFTQNYSSQYLGKIMSLYELFLKNNSEEKNSKEKLSIDVNTLF